MAITVTGKVHGDPDVYMNRAGDISVSFDVLLAEDEGASPSRPHFPHTVCIVVAVDPLAERLSQELLAGADVVVSGYAITIETWHDDGPRAVVLAQDLQILSHD